MILRRPYAFLIKHFRIIHLIMFAFLAYLTFKSSNIVNFFKDYISYNGNIEVISSNYLDIITFIAALFITILSLTIYFLMRYKQKPRMLYIIIIIITILSTILSFYLYTQIRILEITSMPAREIRLLRDFSRFNYWGLFIITIPILIRGLGFDIKKFNFTKDIADLKLEIEDSEEVEIAPTINSESIMTLGRKYQRELKYYYLENKIFINIIIVAITLILILIFPIDKYVINRDLNEGEILGTNNFNIKVIDSYFSDYKRINPNSSYLIVKFSAKAKTAKVSLNLDYITVQSKNREYVPSLKYYYYFEDIGTGYHKENLSTETYNTYILIYNIDAIDKSSNLTLNYLGNKRKIKLSPTYLD